MPDNLKRHRPDIMVVGEGKAMAYMPVDPMGVWCHIQEVRDLLDAKDQCIRDFKCNWIPRPKTLKLKRIKARSPKTPELTPAWADNPERGEYWVYDAEDVDRIIAAKDKEIEDLKKKLVKYVK